MKRLSKKILATFLAFACVFASIVGVNQIHAEVLDYEITLRFLQH